MSIARAQTDMQGRPFTPLDHATRDAVQHMGDTIFGFVTSVGASLLGAGSDHKDGLLAGMRIIRGAPGAGGQEDFSPQAPARTNDAPRAQAMSVVLPGNDIQQLAGVLRAQGVGLADAGMQPSHGLGSMGLGIRQGTVPAL